MAFMCLNSYWFATDITVEYTFINVISNNNTLIAFRALSILRLDVYNWHFDTITKLCYSREYSGLWNYLIKYSIYKVNCVAE